MMKKYFLPFIVLFLVACNKNNNADSEGNLEGQFSVTKVEGKVYYNNSLVYTEEDENSSGYIDFDSDGSGYQNYSFTLNNTNHIQEGSFYWTADENYVYVKRIAEDDLVWTREINEKDKQVISFSYDEDSQTTIDYTLTLEK